MGVPTGNKPNVFTQAAAGAPVATAPRPGVPVPSAGGSSSGKIQLSHTLENVEESTRLEYGTFPAFIEGQPEEITAKSSGNQGIRFRLRFINFPGVATNNPNANRVGFHSVYFSPKALWKVKNTFVAVGQPNAITEFDAEEADRVLVMVEVTKDSYIPENAQLDANQNPIPRETARCDTLIAWPVEYGGPGTKYTG